MNNTNGASGFRVQRAMCATCIFRPESPLDLKQLLDDIADQHGGFCGHRICHHSRDACCAGFWAAHRNEFALGQISQRLNMVVLVDDDVIGDEYVRNTRSKLESSAS